MNTLLGVYLEVQCCLELTCFTCMCMWLHHHRFEFWTSNIFIFQRVELWPLGISLKSNQFLKRRRLITKTACQNYWIIGRQTRWEILFLQVPDKCHFWLFRFLIPCQRSYWNIDTFMTSKNKFGWMCQLQIWFYQFQNSGSFNYSPWLIVPSCTG